MAFFCPAKWSYCIENIKKCATAPGVKLSQLATLYQDADLARELVASQIAGLYAMTTGTYQMNTAVVQQAAEMFVAHYGRTCSVYDMMLYFAHYTIEFKGNNYQLDMQDILKQFKLKYPEWRSRIDTQQAPPPTRKAGNEVTGIAALKNYIVRKMQAGEDARQTNLYKVGIVTEKMIAECQKIANGDIF